MLVSTRRNWHVGAVINVNEDVVLVIAGMRPSGIMEMLGQPGEFGIYPA